jgi:hypothetical protein
MPEATVFQQLADPHADPAPLDPGVTFHSPVADYQGQADVTHLLGLISTLVKDVRAVHELGAPGERATFFTAQVGERSVTGVVHERRDGERIVDVTLMLRPLAHLLDAIRAMGAALAAAPLPSAR